ncbi:MAG: hypothetical protein IKD04_07225 [Clostridia bacterium]|nr:hypothetical protein [Clostridia bacterium]
MELDRILKVLGEKTYLPSQDAVDYLAEQLELMRTAAFTAAHDMTVCQCEYRKESKLR